MFKSEIKYAPWFAKDKKNGLQTHPTTNIPKWQVNTHAKTLTNTVPHRATSSHTFRKPVKHTIRKLSTGSSVNEQREKGYLTYIIKGLRILGANQQNNIITSEYLEEVHHLQYPSHAFTVLTARSEEWNKNKQRVGGVCCRHLPTPGGTPKAGTCSSERRAGIVFYW